LRGGWRWRVSGGPSGAPALGPTPCPYRESAIDNPVAPISHHWLDSTHIAFGVVTAGVVSNRWQLEASAFNGANRTTTARTSISRRSSVFLIMRPPRHTM